MDVAQQRKARDKRRRIEDAEHGAEIPDSPNRFRDWPANSFRPHEDPRTGSLFGNGSQPAKGKRTPEPRASH